MARNMTIDVEIAMLKKMLMHTAEKYKYNFRHPQVLELSRKLDALINQVMHKDYTAN